MEATKHTPLPWKAEDTDANTIEIIAPWSHKVKTDTPGYGDYRGIHVCIIEHQGENVCVSKEAAEANAKLIVRAVNAHEALVEALALVSRSFEDVALGRGGWAWEDILDDVNAALALAKGE